MSKSSQKDPKRSKNLEASDDSETVDDRTEPENTETEPEFSVVEFTDGVNIVSTTWLSADGKCCQWPPKNINISYKKLVQFHARPALDWIEAKVVRSFGTYQKFDVAQNKLQLALQFSDIDTDVDEPAKQSFISNGLIDEDSDEAHITLPPFPAAPQFQKSKPAKNNKSKGNDSTDKGKAPMASPTSQPNKIKPAARTNFQNSDDPSPSESCSKSSRPYNDDTNCTVQISTTKPRTTPDSEFVETLSGAASTENSTRDKIAPSATSSFRHHSVVKSNYPDKTITEHSDGFIAASNLRELNEKLQSIEANLAELTLSVGRTMSAMEKLERHLRGVGSRNGALEGPSAEVLLELETIFPLQTMEAFQNFEASLKSNPQRAQNVVLMWKKIGGDSFDDAIRRILRRVFTNRLAENFSWEGRKGKAKLCDLEITKRMTSALSGVAGMNEADFEKRVKEWFRHAKTRRENEEKRDQARAAGGA